MAHRTGNTYYDYDNQAWVENGRYKRCGHGAAQRKTCKCYGLVHEGESANPGSEEVNPYPREFPTAENN